MKIEDKGEFGGSYVWKMDIMFPCRTLCLWAFVPSTVGAIARLEARLPAIEARTSLTIASLRCKYVCTVDFSKAGLRLIW